jgi:hypothetical protein
VAPFGHDTDLDVPRLRGQGQVRLRNECFAAVDDDALRVQDGALALVKLETTRVEVHHRQEGPRPVIPAELTCESQQKIRVARRVACTAGLRRVVYTSVKPPIAWVGKPAEAKLGEGALTQRTVFFEGSAREAATQYPQNANVGATVSLAGLGLDRTIVRLVSDPDATGPLGIIEAEGDFGSFRFEILAYASPENPKTSTLTAHSLVMAVREGVCFSV